MKRNEKKWILVLVAITVLLIIVLIVKNSKKEVTKENSKQLGANTQEYVQVLENGTKLNTSTKLKETKMLDSLEIGNIQLTNKNGQSVLLADVKNTGSMETQVMLINIVLLDETGTEIATVPGIISPLKVGESTQLNTSMQQDYVGIYDFRVVKK